MEPPAILEPMQRRPRIQASAEADARLPPWRQSFKHIPRCGRQQKNFFVAARGAATVTITED
jgi:hypothetical protein